MNVVILSAKANKIKKYLENTMAGNKFTAYETVEDMAREVLSSALQAQILLVEDSGVSENPANSKMGFNLLEEIISYKFFSVEKIIFINEDSNTTYLARYELLKLIAEKKRVLTSTRNEHTTVRINVGRFKQSEYKGFLVRDVKDYDEVKVNDVVVIQRRRGQEIVGNDLIIPEDIDPNEVYVGEFKQANTEKYKDSFKFNKEPLGSDVKKRLDDVNLETDIVVNPVVDKTKHDKYLMVTGTDNSGVSTTALVMGRSASQVGKTLLIDCGYTNMGLSYLVDKLFLNGEYSGEVTDLNLTDLYDKSISSVIMKTKESSNLHVMRLELPFVRKFEDCIEMVILNLLKQIEDKYDYVIYDLPLRVVSKFSILIGERVDKILMTGLPYENKIISNITQLKAAGLTYTDPYVNGKFYMMLLHVVDKNGLPAVSREKFVNVYCRKLLGKEIPTTGFLKLNHGDDYIRTQYFLDIIEKAGVINGTLLEN